VYLFFIDDREFPRKMKQNKTKGVLTDKKGGFG